MRRLLCLMLGILLGCAQLLAQNRTISGRVTDVKDGSPVPNVSVTVRDGQGGTQTDAQGNYTLSVPSGARFLVFSHVAYEALEVPITNRGVINVTLTILGRSNLQ